ncbi:MAG: TonB-dependent receptor [Pseudomonadales bacterium]|nr:TonB-dependent receptor [Pseudomonadales bacterium]
MIDKSADCSQGGSSIFLNLWVGRHVFSAIIALVLLFPGAINAAETTSSIRGKVISTSGAPLVGASVVVEDLRTGVKHSYSTNSVGTFLASKLPVGGPYRVTVNGHQPNTIDSLALGEIYNLPINLAAQEIVEEVVVVGQALGEEIAAGPSASFGQFDIDTAVAFNRDIIDVYSLDPRISLDVDDDASSVNCAGKHPRFNSTTLDGVSMNDRFGLNDNGYVTAVGMPFPFDAIQQVSVSLAPFDVTFGGFSACNINAVTKSGSNEWHGNVFLEHSGDEFKGEKVGDQKIDSGSYNETKKGFSVGGPIIKDKLFVFAAYEKNKKPRFISQAFDGSGSGGIQREFLSETDYNRILNISNNLYNYDPGSEPGNGAQKDEKYMLKVDWNINDDHNLSLIYNYYDGTQDRDSDGDSNEFEFSNHFYQKGSKSETFTAQLISQWTDAFSTEIFLSNTQMDDAQVTVGPKDFGDFQISINGRDGTVYLGADDSRQANGLNTESTFFKISAQYLLGDHVITAGYEQDKLDIFNIFVQHSAGGEYDFFDSSEDNPAACAALTAQGRFDDTNCGISGIDAFELGRPSRVYYGSGGGTNNPNDAAAEYSNTEHSLYLQDELFFDAYDLSIVFGLRYDFFTSNDRPKFNQTFADANGGLRNDENIDGLDILMPRFGLTWGASDTLTVRAGVGLYSGGNPNVWLANAWSNDGLTNVQLQNFYGGSSSVFNDIALSGAGRPGFDVPQDMVDAVAAVTPANASDSRVVLIDPDYKQPGEWKFALGATIELPRGITADVDYLHTEAVDSAHYVDLSQAIVGETLIGTPIYDYVNGEDNQMLTNSSRNGSSDVFSLILRKDFENGLDMQLGYSHVSAKDISPMTNSTAQSNFDNLALLDINNPRPATSNYEVPHRFTFRASYGHEFFPSLETRFTMYALAQEGQAGSYVMGGGDLEGDGFYGRHLLYIPTDIGDPFVVFGENFQSDEFFAWVEDENLGSGFVKRNQKNASWSSRIDIRIDQELPTFIEGVRGRIFFKLYNLGNLLDKDWGTVTDAQFFSIQQVDASVDGSGRFVYEDFNDLSLNDVKENASLWEGRIGIEISF